MKKLSICIITPTFPPECASGGGIYSYEIAQRLAAVGHQVRIITCLHDISSRKDSKLEIYPVKSGSLLLFPLQARRIFKEKIKSQVDILHGNHIYHWLLCLLKPGNVKKIITTTHNSYLQRFYFYGIWRKLSYPLLILLEQLAYKYSSKIIVVSKLAEEFVLKYKNTKNKTILIPNGVDEQKFKPQPSVSANIFRERFNLTAQDELILFTGRLDRNKSPFSVIKALKLVDTNVHFLVVGRGKVKQELRQLVNNLNLTDRVHFIGRVPYEKMPSVYNSADLFILVSKSEGMPFSLLEAGACGLPLLATENATGLMRIVIEGKNGFIVNNGNVKNIAEKIERALANKRVMGENSRKIIITNYTWDVCFRKLEKLFKSIA